MALDHPVIFPADIEKLMSGLNHRLLSQALADPQYYRWVEPITRAVMYHMADRYCAIWYPMAERVQSAFNKPCDILPPVIRPEDYDTTPLTNNERATVLSSLLLPSDSIIYFINGTVYDFSDEFERFLKAAQIVAVGSERPIAILVCGTPRQNVNVETSSFHYRALGRLSEDSYNRFLKLADVVCAPGMANSFNRYRLSSRLVKGMIHTKPIFTFKAGFGESLRDDIDGFFTHTDDVSEWSEVFRRSLSAPLRESVGANGRALIEKHFAANVVAENLATSWARDLSQKRSGWHRSSDGLLSTSDQLRNVERIYYRHVPLKQRQLGRLVLKQNMMTIYEARPGALLLFGFKLKSRGRYVLGKGPHTVTNYAVAFSVSRNRMNNSMAFVMAKDTVTNANSEFFLYDEDGLVETKAIEVGDSLHLTFESPHSTFVLFKPKWRRRNPKDPASGKVFFFFKDILYNPLPAFSDEYRNSHWPTESTAIEGRRAIYLPIRDARLALNVVSNKIRSRVQKVVNYARLQMRLKKMRSE